MEAIEIDTESELKLKLESSLDEMNNESALMFVNIKSCPSNEHSFRLLFDLYAA